MIYQEISIIVISLSIFFFSINLISKYLTNQFSAKAQRVIKDLSANCYLMFICGIVFSFILHSSSALIALVITFASLNYISTKGALNLTLGANIGTTLTAFIIIIDFSQILVFIFLLGIILIFSKKEVGTFLFSFGLLYFSLNMFSDSLANIIQHQALINLLSTFNNFPLLALLIGFLIVLIVQSSTLFLSFLKTLSAANLIMSKGLIGLILGANIGTTADGFLLVRNKKGLNIALFNLIFNIGGAILFLFILNPFSYFIDNLMISDSSKPVMIHFIYNIVTAILGFILINNLRTNKIKL